MKTDGTVFPSMHLFHVHVQRTHNKTVLKYYSNIKD